MLPINLVNQNHHSHHILSRRRNPIIPVTTVHRQIVSASKKASQCRRAASLVGGAAVEVVAPLAETAAADAAGAAAAMAAAAGHWHALALTCMGAGGTALGGALVCLQPKMDFQRLGLLQVMMMCNTGIKWVCRLGAGRLPCCLLSLKACARKIAARRERALRRMHAHCARHNTQRKQPPPTPTHNPLPQGLAAGLMLSISIMELLPDAISEVGFVPAQLWFYAGTALFAAVVALIPEPDAALLAAAVAGGGGGGSGGPGGGGGAADCGGDSKGHDEDKARRHRAKVLMSGLITAVGIALHNFPEGVAVFLAAHKSSGIGLSLALAIALHNIPEGVAVALPVYFATGSRLRGFNTAAASGLAEPLAVVLLAVLLPSGKLPHAWVEMVRVF